MRPLKAGAAALACLALWLGGRALRRGNDARGRGSRYAEDAATAWDMALHVLSHDLRAPQASLLALLELHKEGARTDAAVFERIGEHASDSLRRIDDVLRLLRETRHVYRTRRFDVDGWLDECLDRVWQQASNAGVRVELVPPASPAWISGDRAWLADMLALLLGMAVAACRPETVVSLRCELEDRGVALHLTFAPVSAEHAVRMTEPGPALLFAQRVVARHGGTLVPLRPLALEAVEFGESGISGIDQAGWGLWLP